MKFRMTDSRDTPSEDFAATPLGDGLSLVAWIFLLVALGAGAGVLFAPDDWYDALLKPTFNPPSAVFGPVWTVLYALMAVALWLVRRHRDADDRALRRRATQLFAIQLVLNRPRWPSVGCVRWRATCCCRTCCGCRSRWC